MRKLVLFLLIIFSVSLVTTSCQSSNQCKRFKKKQRKQKRRRAEVKQDIDFNYARQLYYDRTEKV